jgi:uncharacterized protein with von Willebrand factor type A (vWA) domain
MNPDDFLAKIRSARATRRRKSPPSRQSIRTNFIARDTWEMVRKDKQVDGTIINLYTGGGGAFPALESAPELVADLFAGAHQVDPELRPQSEVLPESWPARRILEALLKSPGFQELRQKTVADEVMSTLVIPKLGKMVEEILEHTPAPPQRGGNESDDESDESGGGSGGGKSDESGDDESDDESDESGGGSGGDEKSDKSGGKPDGSGDGSGGSGGDESDDDELDKSAKSWEEACEEAWEDQAIESVIEEGVQKAADGVEALAEVKKSIGMDKAAWAAMPFDERMKMAEEFDTPRMREILKWIGRMTRYALGVRATRVIDVPSEPWNVTVGRDVTKVLSSELALLGNEITKHEFWRKYAQGQLLQYALRGEAPSTGGRIIVCVDISYSMAGDPIAWAIGLCEALRRVSRESERDLHIIEFNGGIVREFEFLNGEGSPSEVLALLRTAPAGGTDFEPPLTRALELLGNTRDDMVFITDGYGYLPDEFMKNFNAVREQPDGFRVFSMYIGGGTPPPILEKFSNFVIPVIEITAFEAQKIFTHIH